MAPAKPIPTCLSIIVCDAIYRDDETKNLIIVGTFNAVGGPGYPVRLPRMCVLLTLTNGHGRYDMSLSVEHEQIGQHLVELRGPLEMTDPLEIADFIVKLGDFAFPAPGKYWVVVKIDDVIVAQRPIIAAESKPPEEPKNA